MILSRKHRYLFVELPLTGSTAVAHELIEMYGGESILKKHSTYADFLRLTPGADQDLFVFSGIRNPLDQAVSKYMKAVTDHRGRYTRDLLDARNRRDLFTFLNALRRRRIRRFAQAGPAGFERYFLRQFKVAYCNWSVLSHKRMAGLLRFESLAADFDAVLRRIGIEPIRPIPVRNQTAEKQDWEAFYASQRVRERAVHVFSPFMEYWGYEFPADWHVSPANTMNRIDYSAVKAVATVYWKYFRDRL